MNALRRGFGVLLLLGASSCAHVPPEAVDLSAKLGSDLGTVREANLALAQTYFGRLRDDINAFVDEEYRPFVVRHAMESLDLIGMLRAPDPELGLDELDLMEIFVVEAMARIDSFRMEMLTPLNAREDSVLASIDAAYAAMIRANAEVTAHLASIRKVTKEQERLIGTVGLPPDLRMKITTQLAGLSNQVNEVLADAKKVDGDIEGAASKVRELLK